MKTTTCYRLCQGLNMSLLPLLYQPAPININNTNNINNKYQIYFDIFIHVHIYVCLYECLPPVCR